MEQIVNNPADMEVEEDNNAPPNNEEEEEEEARFLRRHMRNHEPIDSDPDDPKYLATLSEPFSRKLKKQKTTIAMLENVLLNTQRIAMEREARVNLLTREVIRLKTIISRSAQSVRDHQQVRMGRDPQTLLMEELWLLVFDKFDDARDTFTCYTTCSFFKNALEGTKQVWMFQLVLPILFEKLRKTDILNCRRVCARWRHGVDFLLENCVTRRPYKPSSECPAISLQVMSPFRNPLAIKGLEKIVNPHVEVQDNLDGINDRLPLLVGRAVTFCYSPELQEPPDVFWERVERFLQICGQDLLYVNILITTLSENNVYSLLAELLPLMPNLKHLGISADTSAQENFTPNLELLPNLPKLESMFVLFRQTDLKLERAFLSKYAAQLGKLETSKWESDFSSLEMPHLKEFKVHLEQWGQPSGLLNMREMREHRTFSSSPVLTHLFNDGSNISKLVLGPLGTGECVKLLFRILDKLPKLESLRVWFGAVTAMSKVIDEMQDIIRRLPPDVIAPPHLHALEVDQSFKTLDYVFLTRFPRIKNIHIRHEDGSNFNNVLMDMSAFTIRTEFVEIHKHLYKGEMYKSNVWTLLPNLKVLTYVYPGVRAHHGHGHGHPAKPAYAHAYDRDGYELYLKKQQAQNTPSTS